MHRLCLSLAIGLFVASCSHPDESTLPLHAPGPFTPVVTGLRITGPAGPVQIAVWGVPSDPASNGSTYSGGTGDVDSVEPGPIPNRFDFYNTYPNPSDGSLAIAFALPRQSAVNLWIVRARWSGNVNTDVVSIGGSTIPAPNNGAIRTFLHSYELSAGSYRAIWDGRNDNGEPVSGGFYRVYFQADGFTSWRDILLYRSLEEIPGDLRSILHR
jgi:hypothetical protein